MKQALTLNFAIGRRRIPSAWSAFAIGLAIFGLLWFLNAPFRQVYQPSDNDVTALADGSLLVPGATWKDWFIQGHSRFFDPYPEWPLNVTAFARPGFQFLIYVAHFVLGRDWASYLALNYLGVAGVAAVAFAIARTTLRLSNAASTITAILVALSPAVLEFSIWQVGFASEAFASILVGCAYLSVAARRDFLCLVFLCLALITKETAVWAPLAAALTVLLRPPNSDVRVHRVLAAAVMLLPLAMWLLLRWAFFGGIGGTYVTADYSPFLSFLALTSSKLTHLHHLFLQQNPILTQGRGALVDRVLRLATAFMFSLLFIIWLLGGARAVAKSLSGAVKDQHTPAVAPSFIAIWGALATVFYLALAVPSMRYAASAALFFWPPAVAEVMRRKRMALRIAVAFCVVFSLARTSRLLADANPPRPESDVGQFFRAAARMNAALRDAPAEIREIYVLTGGWLVTASPAYLQALLHVKTRITRIADVRSACEGGEPSITLDHAVSDGVVTLYAKLPACASFFFNLARVRSAALADGQLRRSDTISYELPQAQAIERKGPLEPALDLGQRIIVHIRPSGPARFLFEPSGPVGGLGWFDTP